MVHPSTLGRGWLFRRLARVRALAAVADAAAPGAVVAVGVARVLAGVPAGIDAAAVGHLAWAAVVAVVLVALADRTAYAGERALAGLALHELGRGWLGFLGAPAPDPAAQASAFVVAGLAGLALVAGRRALAPGRA